ncbi:DNA processing protein DprA [Sulfurimicrobium lacus]|uniref:DNA processing protein DprA n=1 Tax=Sulfurimicrobium lacus TaxID=2715678 RepID=A0A6F8V735_9PROT|nr:DNA-processing protein DprA [Sulfurimicrobium lacus]BCB25120.1 DNA processing protein DprA [Sulfurimicrobium lacus]
MSSTQDSSQWVALSLIPGLGGETYRSLLQSFGEPAKIFAARPGALEKVVRAPIARAIATGPDQDAVAPTLRWLEEPGNHIVTLADTDYPRGLLEIPDPPPLLYVKGRRDLLNQPALAIVGSRNATPQGLTNAQTFARFLSDSGLCIVSGMALGIDGAAHRGALQGAASSIAVVGTGLDIVYPARHRDLAHELAQNGALVSEFPIGTPSKSQNFPRRNRIISGISQGCLVIEAALQSGSLITARLAAEQGRDVFAIPGSIHSPLAKGCHFLIKQGAKLVENAQDILDEFGYPAAASTISPCQPTSATSENEKRLRHCLGFDPIAIDALVACSGLTSDSVCAILLSMELAGQVSSLPGGLFQSCNHISTPD